jgi:hypothetical protein
MELDGLDSLCGVLGRVRKVKDINLLFINRVQLSPCFALPLEGEGQGGGDLSSFSPSLNPMEKGEKG